MDSDDDDALGLVGGYPSRPLTRRCLSQSSAPISVPGSDRIIRSKSLQPNSPSGSTSRISPASSLRFGISVEDACSSQKGDRRKSIFQDFMEWGRHW